jgi:putative endonuclease
VPHSDPRVALGKQGEALACHALQQRGYVIIATRYRTRHGEIDVIARDGTTLVFVEVKTRTTTDFGTGRDAVTRHKRRQIASVASHYLATGRFRHPPPRQCRFDIVSILGPTGQTPQIDVVTDAFTLDDC